MKYRLHLLLNPLKPISTTLSVLPAEDHRHAAKVFFDAGNGTGSAEISTDPYELNKLNAGKPGFTEDGEIIMGHKFKYFRKGDKKGQVYSGQLFVAIGPQACPHVKVLPRKDFTKNTVDAYLTTWGGRQIGVVDIAPKEHRI
ncbi:hypothetical protein ACMFMG_009511 [Clarireedia jacksonii]